MRLARSLLPLALALSGLALSGCETTAPTLKPQVRPAGLAKPAAPKPAAPVSPSAQSLALKSYYARVQSDLLTQGLMRTDGGGPDTQFGPDDLLRDFERIAFYDEHARGSLGRADGRAGYLHRWQSPVRMKPEFGPSVSDSVRAMDTATITGYAARLSRVTRHPIGLTRSASANFHVLVMGQDDTDYLIARVKQIAPNISPSALSVFRNLPKSIHCLVLAFPGTDDDNEYQLAIAMIRAEHPDLLRKSCYHEELAQGLGLANDSPRARPSIFNDDDEFALLTTHDEMLLQMLYDPRLRPGMSLEQARPIAKRIAIELTGQNF
ncbi:DUF2927 domain-containing protein [Rhodalgimonas zhirmunskyi]|uniref:DUF2927 domain-containing protein n=1 Tax=Rhodalgimonas zhirmunskyi TaxID=2964767 RepID=A0AAJ1U7S1_9RHOB|nr:DUF2927 domain-containing protein [Rhodoalgimonas zhirmunskyi]MDQ2094981.1 DUF2927 domain-containing protein [Rhodoalgimonas zhirmunskyi]